MSISTGALSLYFDQRSQTSHSFASGSGRPNKVVVLLLLVLLLLVLVTVVLLVPEDHRGSSRCWSSLGVNYQRSEMNSHPMVQNRPETMAFEYLSFRNIRKIHLKTMTAVKTYPFLNP